MSRLLAGVILLSLFFTMAAAGAGAGEDGSDGPAVVISRVETNPSGSDGGLEWAEIFNPDGADAPIGGWRLVAKESGATATLPDGAIVPAQGALRASFGEDGLSLADSEESIRLLDESGTVVDETPPINDSENGNNVWTRISFDDEILQDWRFESLYRRIDELADDAPAEAESSPEDLALYLSGSAESDEERARAIYRWITANVEYDVGASVSAAYRGRPLEEVLDGRKGVCSDYSRLFERLCELSGLEAVVIRGFGKGYGYTVGSKIPNSSNHAWNAVRINGEWRLIDSTWGAGHLDPAVGFFREFEEFYFLTPPEDLVWTHLPDDPAWQLLDVPMTRVEFEGLVYAKPAFFRDDLKIAGSPDGTIEADGWATVNLSAPRDVRVIAELLDGDGRELPSRFAQVRRSPEGEGEGEGASVRAACPGPGEYTLRIYSNRFGGEDQEGDREGGKEADQKVYDWALDYRIEAGPDSPVQTGFPVIWDAFWDLGLDFKSHPEGLIETGAELKVTLSAPEDVLLLARLLNDGGKELAEERTFAQREEDGYAVMASFPEAGDYTLRIYARRGGDGGDGGGSGGGAGEYTSVVEYSVVADDGIEERTFPRTMGSFAEVGATLISPLEGRLVAGNATEFEIIVPGAEDATVISDGTWTPLTRDGETFRGVAVLSKGEAKVAARFSEERSYGILLVYEVV
ncbi:MAG TPA: transglutaminase domain-containing protein [Methanothrix sp.]|nr:transglutaminase domain-containing protein [Methanothrix sp.]